MKIININVSSKKYNIHIGKGILLQSGEIIKGLGFNGKLLIVTDDNVAPLYLEKVENSIKDSGIEAFHVILPNGEEHKNMDSVMKIYDAASKNNLNRKDMFVALGGGVIGDMTGFAAATFLRGVKYVQIPTTLLAQVDSSIGGKTGIDLPFGKNLVGAFCQPEAVIADSSVIKTLTDEHIASGMAEVIKSAFIRKKDFVDLLLNSTDFEEDVEEFIIRSMNVKKEVVEIDEFEKYERMMLNFGHTLGHSIEKLMNFTGISHGQAVAIGMSLITKNTEVKEILDKILYKYNLKTEINIPVNKLIDA
ncbi:MAG: 3-dehydroquinate synthase, partial [Clostridia bacterium]|nr:3-dehydroquinate synthase [Clostridia bacterium]